MKSEEDEDKKRRVYLLYEEKEKQLLFIYKFEGGGLIQTPKTIKPKQTKLIISPIDLRI